MKIGILTLSASDNCGSLFQTYALQRYLEDNNYEVEVINFINHTSRKMYRLFHPGYIKQPKKFFGQFINMPKLIEQKKSYNQFRKIINLTNEIYRTSEDLITIDGKYDMIIVGSDQVWSVNMRDFDCAYFLEWCKKSKKMAYAASLGSKNENTYDMFVKYKRVIQSIDNISIRELSSCKMVSSIIQKPVSVAVDPTLLIEKNIWHEIADETIEKPKSEYIFYYSYGYINENKNKLVCQFGKKMGLPVYVVNASRWVDGKDKKYGFKRIKKDGPYAFLSLMEGCTYSFVESFHGIIFSYIFRRNFWYIENSDVKQLDERIESVLELFALKDRVMYTDNINVENLEIDYSGVNSKYQNEIEKSKQYLNIALNNK